MKVDLYTKVVLTVIAVSLAVLAVRGGIEPARALGDGCGDIANPCYVATYGETLNVRVDGTVEIENGRYNPLYVAGRVQTD